MKIKTINAVITKKVNEWLESITDQSVRELVKTNVICTGGAIASMLLREEPNDFDLYLRTREAAQALANYYVAEFKKNPPPRFKDSNKKVEIRVDTSKPDRIAIVVKSAGVAGEKPDNNYSYFESQPEADAGEYVAKVMDQAEPETPESVSGEKPKYRPVFLSANAITLSGDIQIVLRFYGEPTEIHANYDFVHVTNYWTSWDKKVVVNPEALEALLTKELRYVGSKYPLCSIIRLRKFIGRGWTINAGQILKMALNLQTFNLLDIAVLEEQLTGVDVAYFSELLSKLHSENVTAIDSAYLVEIIDRMF